MILRARVVLPISRPPIPDGAVLITDHQVTRVGSWKDISRSTNPWSTAVNLGDVALLPGLVNAHCHLDYTDMSGTVPPQKSFTDWIKLITTAKSQWNDSEFADSWLHGAQMLVRTGTTTVADFEAVPKLLPQVWSVTPLRVISFLELTGVKSRRNPRLILREALGRIKSLPPGRCRAVLAPHAPYSTVPELLRLSARTARHRKWPISIHVAESLQEFEMFMQARGELFNWLQKNERDPSDCGVGSPVQQLERAGALDKNLLAIHVNYLGERDAVLLGIKKVSVVHCPRSHAYFHHARFPFRELARAKVNVCLGTDSLATVLKKRRERVELNLFDEMRAFAAIHPRLSAEKILRMVTVNPARALGLTGDAGEISEGAFADLIAIPFAGRAADAYDAVLNHRGNVTASMIAGRWALAPER
jgi:cytosine/adenosine deaminase-related metal-dependent hydrolase